MLVMLQSYNYAVVVVFNTLTYNIYFTNNGSYNHFIAALSI